MYYAGIDAHKRYVVVAVVSNTAERVLAPTRIPVTEKPRLVEVLRPYRPLEVVTEASPFWPWIHERLVEVGVGFVLAHSKKLRAIAGDDQKRDESDAELLARMLQAGLIPEVYPKPWEQLELAQLVRHRAALGRHRTALANRIHSQLQSRGLILERGRLLTQAGQEWVRSEAWPQLGPEQQRVVETHLQLIAELAPMIRKLEARIDDVGAEQPGVEILRSVPGIGPYRALLLAVEILPLWRYRGPSHLVSYGGALVRAVVSHVRAAPDSHLSRYYARQKDRLGWPTARVATARKLCRILYAMLRDGEHWRDSG
ncbi:MAG: IS110 family transposase [Gammaproteobacteria bacterium]|nr:IS110 family transposase [Gammaproteobacteria bacterium]